METDVYQFLAEKSRGLSGHKILTIGQALLKYQAEVASAKAFKTRESNLVSIRRLMKSLKDVEVADLGYPDAIEYRDGIGGEFGRSAANTDLGMLSHLYTKLIEWGAIKNRDHPLRGHDLQVPEGDTSATRKSSSTTPPPAPS